MDMNGKTPETITTVHVRESDLSDPVALEWRIKTQGKTKLVIPEKEENLISGKFSQNDDSTEISSELPSELPRWIDTVIEKVDRFGRKIENFLGLYKEEENSSKQEQETKKEPEKIETGEKGNNLVKINFKKKIK